MVIRKVKAFTLVELITVVAIIGILAAVGIISYNGYIKSTKKTSAKNIMQQIALAQTEYLTENGSYFSTDIAADTEGVGGTTCTSSSVPSSATSTAINNTLLGSKTITVQLGYNMCIFLGTASTSEPDYTIVAAAVVECIGTLDSDMQWGGCFSE